MIQKKLFKVMVNYFDPTTVKKQISNENKAKLSKLYHSFSAMLHHISIISYCYTIWSKCLLE